MLHRHVGPTEEVAGGRGQAPRGWWTESYTQAVRFILNDRPLACFDSPLERAKGMKESCALTLSEPWASFDLSIWHYFVSKNLIRMDPSPSFWMNASSPRRVHTG